MKTRALLLLSAAAPSTAISATPYGNPYLGCNANELNLSVTGVPGLFCSPKCSVVYENGCNPAKPSGVTALPECMVGVNSTQNNYCALVCNTQASEDQCDTKHGGACHHVSGVQGICTYASAATAAIPLIRSTSTNAQANALSLFNPSQPAINIDLVRAINTNPQATWVAEASVRFQGWTLGRASNIANGALRGDAQTRPVLTTFTPGVTVPTNFDPRLDPTMARCNATIAHVRDQTDCGGCVSPVHSCVLFILVVYSPDQLFLFLDSTVGLCSD